eukprot:Skav218564  [mRNA]  locus=scaffold1408:420984:424134:- [translate_table: standard]
MWRWSALWWAPVTAAVDLGSASERLEECAQLLLETRAGNRHEERPVDCHFWASYAARDRHVEGSRVLDFNRLAAYRYAPFEPPLRHNGTALYIGAHRSGEDGLEFHRRFALQMHLFECLVP